MQTGIYAALGVSQSLTMFMMGAIFSLLTYYASQQLHGVSASRCIMDTDLNIIRQRAIHRVMYAPMSFFETTPLGRIMNRFAKGLFQTFFYNRPDSLTQAGRY